MKDLYIVGAGGFGKEIAWLIERINAVKNTWDIKGFLDDGVSKADTLVAGYSVIGGVEQLQYIEKETYIVLAIGNSVMRSHMARRIQEFKNPYIHFPTLIDPSVIMSDRVFVGEGSVICAGSILTVDIKLGKCTIINLDCTIGHDVVIDDYVTIYPSVNISGNVSIGSCVEVGTGAQIIQQKTISGNVVLGAGSVVNCDIDIPGTYVGVPVRKISE